MWSDMRLKNYATGNTCIYAAASDKILKSANCDYQDYFVLKEQVASVRFCFYFDCNFFKEIENIKNPSGLPIYWLVPIHL